MKLTKKLFAVLLAALMIAAVLPTAAFAASAVEAQKLAKLDEAWESIERVEAEAMARRATAAETTLAAYKAAANDALIDRGSLKMMNEEKFSFTVDGMHCMYYYGARVQENAPEANVEVFTPKTAGNWAQALDVLLVGPYYGVQSTFTDQYKEEAQSIADATGGTVTLLSGSAATGPAIAQNYPGKGVVIYDSHGTQEGDSSYLCLTTNSGITTTDYSNGWAVSSGDAAFIDGRYVQNHVTETLSNCLVWMAICEGMKKSGNGTTGTALLAAGAGVVYGYSQSVSFSGDYEYEATFWNEMKDGATVADAFATMVATHGQWDPAYSSSSGSAWPIVMSADDPFPANPDSAQTVYSDWTLFSQEPVALESFEIGDNLGEPIDHATMAQGKKVSVKILAEPMTANGYTVAWAIADTDVATVAPSTNGKNAVITGVNIGSTTLTATVTTESKAVFTQTIDITVTEAPQWKPTQAIVPGEEYLIGFVVNGMTYLMVNYNNNASNHYYNSISSTYYGYTAPAVMNGANVIGVYGNADDLDFCTWKFETTTGGHIYSGYQDGYYLQVYTGTSYADLHPGTNSDYTWTFDPAARTLYTYTTANRYAQYYTDGSNTLMCVSSTVPTNGYIQLFSVNGEGGDATYYTVTFKDWDGTVLSTQQIAEGYPAYAPANPVRPGYRFVGWDKDFSNITGDLIVTAVYEEIELGDTAWMPTDTIVPGEDYLIGFVVNGVTYLAVNCNVSQTGNSQYYNSISNSYYGYTAPAEMAGEYVVGVSGNANELQYCTWKFNEATSGYTIQSGYQDSYYLNTWSSTYYADLHPGTNTTHYWQWNGSDKTLYRSVDGTNRYAQYYTTGGGDYMCVGTGIPGNGYVQLFHEVEIEPPTPATYTVTFIDDLTNEVIATVEVEEGGDATPPEAPVHEGYTFVGWEGSYTNVQEDCDVYAIYEEIIVPPTGLLGDVDCNGTVDMSDISMLFSYLNGTTELTEQGLANANANGDDTVNVMDITAIFNIIANS